MAHDLSLDAKLNKNEVSTGIAEIPLIELTVANADDDKIVRVCANNEDLIWNGRTWKALPIQVGDIETNLSQIPTMDLKLQNIDRILEGYYEETNGGVGSVAIIRIVRARFRNNDGIMTADASPSITEIFDVQQATLDDSWCTLTLGFDWSTNTRRPLEIYKKDHCDHVYGDVKCGVAAAKMATYPTCDGTWKQCEERDNCLRFKGVLTIGEKQKA